jgi:hypothetical protein
MRQAPGPKPSDCDLTQALRETCEWIAARSTQVRVISARVEPYARELHLLAAPADSKRVELERVPQATARETAAAHWLTIDAINFGSGWFPTLRKREQPTGYRTIAAGVTRRFEQAGRWRASELARIDATELAAWLDQEPDHELVGLMAASLRDLGENVRRLYGGSFAAVVDGASGSAVALVKTLAGWRSFADISTYEGRPVPFLKRAQIAAADLQRAGVADFRDHDRLTMFADNLVPHVLRLDGVLWFDPELVERIERGELIVHGSPEEVEIRACAVHAVELLAAAATDSTATRLTAAQIDQILWNRGQAPEYKALPRHRSRSTAY